MSHRESFALLLEGLQNKFTNSTILIDDFLPFYEDALLFIEFCQILPNNEFNNKRISLISRNLAISIFFAINGLYEEAQILLRQKLDLIYMILYGANHVLEIESIETGKNELIGNVRNEVNRKLDNDLKGRVNKLYRNLSCVVHGTIKDILSEIIEFDQNWESKSKLGHWKKDFNQALSFSTCLCRSWLPENYAKLDITLRVELEKKYFELKHFFQ